MAISVVRKVDDFLGSACRILTAVSIALQMFIVVIGVVFRYFLRSPLTWPDELSCFLLVFVTFFGCAVAMKDLALARIELCIDRLPQVLRTVAVLVANLLIFVLLVTITYFGIVVFLSPTVQKQITPAMELPIFWFYGVIPLSALIMLVHLVVETYDLLFQKEQTK